MAEPRDDAIEHLEKYAGVDHDRAVAIADAVASAAGEVALRVSSGQLPPATSVTEARARLYEEVFDALKAAEKPPLRLDEVLVVFRVSEAQARSLMRQLRVRKPALQEQALAEALGRLKVSREGVEGGDALWEIKSGDADVLEYGKTKLRRLGVTSGVELNTRAGTLRFPQLALGAGDARVDTRAELGLEQA